MTPFSFMTNYQETEGYIMGWIDGSKLRSCMKFGIWFDVFILSSVKVDTAVWFYRAGI